METIVIQSPLGGGAWRWKTRTSNCLLCQAIRERTKTEDDYKTKLFKFVTFDASFAVCFEV